MKIQPSELCSDAEFLRRVSLDLTGLPPAPDEVRKFLADPRDTRVKRDELIDRLVGSEAYIDHWTNKWADLLQVNRKFLAGEGAAAYRKWIRDEAGGQHALRPVRSQDPHRHRLEQGTPPAAYFKILRTPQDTMETTTHLFLAVRFNCNKCHDHPFERWTQDQYYQTAAYFAQVGLQRDPASGDRNIGGTRGGRCQAAVRNRLRHRAGRGETRSDGGRHAAAVPVSQHRSRPPRRPPAASSWPLGSRRLTTATSPRAT